MFKRAILFFCLTLATAAVSAAGFTLTDTKGATHNLADYKGKWVLVNFWATWCPPCLEEIPDLINLHEAYKDNKLAVIGIAVDYQNPKQVIEFANNMFITYPIVLGNAKINAQIGQIRGLPTTYLYNPEGKLVASNVGALTRDAVEKYISKKK